MDNEKGMLTFMVEAGRGQFEVSGVPVRAHGKSMQVRVNLVTGEIVADGNVEVPGDEEAPTVWKDGPVKITWDAEAERLTFDSCE